MVLNQCAQCGADLGSGSVGGLCPRCLVRIVRAVPGGTAREAEFPSPTAEQPSTWTRFGNYELLEEVARGGMGVVWRARQAGANRIVALKMILAGRFADVAEVKRFRAEAEAAAQLDHPNIVPIYDVGEEEGQCYFTMKLIEGRSLAQAIREGLCFKVHCKAHRGALLGGVAGRCCLTAARLMAKVARAVHYAHQRGILHRDLTPGNILLDAADEPHVTDFGLAKRIHTEAQLASLGPELTVTGAVLGTPGYLAPEQAAGGARHLTTAADIYSLGAILYELLTGRPPFQGKTALATLQDVQTRAPARPRASNPHLDPDLETICLKCLEKDPAHRYNSAASLADDLERFLRNEPVRARPSTTRQRVLKWARRNPARAGSIVAFIAVTLLGVSGVLLEWRDAVKSRHAAESALRQSQESLWQANFDRAQARRTSRQMGQRVEALRAIAVAAKIRPTPELRNEAIAAMTLTDVEDVGDWLPAPTNMVSYAADGNCKRVAFSLSDGMVEVREFPDGRLLASVSTGQERPNLRLDDAGERLLTGDRNVSRVWDLRTTNLLCEVRTPLDTPDWSKIYREFSGIDAALSPDGRWLSYLVSTSSVAWRQVGAGADSGRISVPGCVKCIAFGGSAEWLAVASEAVTEICRVTDGSHFATLPLGSYPLNWHQSEPLLVLGRNTELAVFGMATNEARVLKLPTDGAMTCWHPNPNLLASAGWDQVLRLWDPFAGVQLLETAFARPFRFSTNGQWLTVNNRRGVGRLKVHIPQECRVFHLPLGHGPGFGAIFSPDDRFLATTADGEIWFWDVALGKIVRHQPVEGGLVGFVSTNAFVSDGPEVGAILWTNSNPTAKLSFWRAKVIVPPDDEPFWEGSFDEAHSLLLVKHGWAGDLYELPSGRLRTQLKGQRKFSYPDISPDGRWVASGYFDNNGRHSSEFWIWSAADGQPVRKIASGNTAARFSPDGRWLLVGDEKVYSQYAVNNHPTNWILVRQFDRDASGFAPGWTSFSPDGKLLTVMANRLVMRLIEATTGRELARFPCGIPSLSRDARWMAVGSGDGLHVWDLALIRARLREMNLDWDGPPDLPLPR